MTTEVQQIAVVVGTVLAALFLLDSLDRLAAVGIG